MDRLIDKAGAKVVSLNDESALAQIDDLSSLQEDPRWQLTERILGRPDFVRSPRLSEFLRYVCRATLKGEGDTLSEQHIGEVIFGRPPNFDSAADSIVRSHALRLRQRLDQYFARAGKDEPMRLLIPRGAYNVVFEQAAHVQRLPEVEPRVDEVSSPEPVLPIALLAEPVKVIPQEPHDLRVVFLPWSLVTILALVCILLVIRQAKPTATAQAPSWPLSTVFDGVNRTQIVLADVNYGMLRIIAQKEGSLEEYLRPSAQQDLAPTHLSEREERIMNYISSSNLTSYADAVVATNLMSMAHARPELIGIRSARDLHLRDLEEGNYIFVGSPGSNPWVSLYQGRLNFREGEGAVGRSMKYFLNEHPQPGEQRMYQGLEFTGSAGEDYATISLLPATSGRGVVLILQGLQQEGTEAAGLFLADEDCRKQLMKALGVPSSSRTPIYFEALIRTRVIAGAPNATNIVAARRISY